MVMYDSASGKSYTYDEVAKMSGLARSPQEKMSFIAEVKTFKKRFIAVAPLPDVPTPQVYKRSFVGTENVVKAIKGLLEAPEDQFPVPYDPNVNVIVADARFFAQHAQPETIDPIIQIPTMREYAQSIPYLPKTEKIREMAVYLRESNIGYALIKARDKQGKVLVYSIGIGGNKVTTEYVRFKMAFPIPDFYGSTYRVPVYTFAFNSSPYWAHFIKVYHERLMKGKFGDSKATVLASKFYEQCITFVNENYFGNGSLQGMLGRIAVMKEAREKYNQERVRQKKDHQFKLREQIRNHMPLRKFKGVVLNTPDMGAILNQTISIWDSQLGELREQPLQRKINPDSNPGPWYSSEPKDPNDPRGPRMKRRDVAFIEPLICTYMLIDCAKVFIDKPGKVQFGETAYDLKAFWKVWGSIRLFNMFPKPEIYKKSERFMKTRCIAAYNSAVMIPTQILMQPIIDSVYNAFNKPLYFKRTGNLWHSNHGSFLMAKQSAFKGAPAMIMGLIARALDWEIGQHWIGIYADNLYVVIKEDENNVTWVSCDGVKAESAISVSTIRNAMIMLLQINDENSGENRANALYQQFFANIFPYVAAEGVGILGNQQIPFPAMGSGVMGTFFFNSYKMAELVISAFLPYGNVSSPNPLFTRKLDDFSPHFKKVMSAIGYKLTIEFTETFTRDHFYTPPLRKMDMLGFDFSLFHITETEVQYFSTLRMNSLLGLTLFRKEYYDEKGATHLSPIEENYLLLIRMRTCYMMGAWAYPPLLSMVLHMALKAHRVLKTAVNVDIFPNLSQDELRQMLFPDDESEFGEQLESLLSLIILPVIPTVYDLVLLQTGKEEIALRAAHMRLGSLPNLFVAPIRVLKEMGVDTADLDKEISISQRELVKLYPAFKAGEIAYFRNPSVVPTLAPTGSNWKETVVQTPSLSVRKVVTKDVGRPIQPAVHAATPQVNENNWNLFQTWIKQLLLQSQQSPIVYRVPIPLYYVGKEDEIKDETKLARSAVVQAVYNNTGYDKSTIKKQLARLSSVNFVVKQQKPNIVLGILPNSFETSSVPLVHGRVMNRAYEQG